MIYRKKLNNIERKMVKGIAEGTRNPNSREAQKILSRPHVAVALESILDMTGLNDSKLCVRLRQVMNRKPLKSKNKTTGTASTNQTAVDANAVQAIRTIWQVKQYFRENIDGSKGGILSQMGEEQLDNIIASGADVIQSTIIRQKKKKEVEDGTE